MGDIQNTAEDFAGKAKEAAGDVTDNEDLQNEGKADQVVSDAKEKVSDAGDAIKDKANEVIGKFKDDK
ncbi:CsbD family protein [Corynebacterium frankenforstense]|uniref:CsbD family protein n=1 Tax=Corynebacterium TaxID=1716 RepID=UPI00255105B8|nr:MULTISPECIES: CsbD family protein [Corynebacterium]MDK6259647.1 CsbD family protein [Corynebacterium frankenforstense]MDK8896219.1 CsbD family protein [Corynebacterium sp. MSK006]